MRNKTILLLLFLASLSTALCGQQNENAATQKGWIMGAYGFIGAAGFAYPTVEPEGNAGPAYQIGVMAQYRFGNRLALRTGLAFSSAKGVVSGKEPDFNFPGLPTIYGDSYEARFKHADLLLPVEAFIDLGKQRDRGMYALLGATLGVALSRQATKNFYQSGLGWSTTQLNDNHSVVGVYNTIGLGYLFRSRSKTCFFVQLSGSSNAWSNLIHSIQRKSDRSVVNWYGLGLGLLSTLR